MSLLSLAGNCTVPYFLGLLLPRSRLVLAPFRCFFVLCLSGTGALHSTLSRRRLKQWCSSTVLFTPNRSFPAAFLFWKVTLCPSELCPTLTLEVQSRNTPNLPKTNSSLLIEAVPPEPFDRSTSHSGISFTTRLLAPWPSLHVDADIRRKLPLTRSRCHLASFTSTTLCVEP